MRASGLPNIEWISMELEEEVASKEISQGRSGYIHTMEALGKSKIVVKNKKVIGVSAPVVRYCPLFDKHRNIKRLDKASIKKNVEFRMRDFGLFSENRVLEQETFVDFGASEIFMTALRRGLLEAVVIVSDGAGTVITSNPKLVQGIGGRISCILETTPIPKLIERIEEAGGHVLNPKTGEINQVDGVRKAIELGHRAIGVSLLDPEDAKECKKLEKEHNVRIVTFCVHTTGMGESKAREAIKHFDLITACASKNIRKVAVGNIKVQAGSSIPIFAVTQVGKDLLLERAKDIEDQILINIEKLPSLRGCQPDPLV